MDPFAEFDLVPRYHLDKAQLRKAFLLRSKALHPDQYAQASAPEQTAALDRSSRLNQAYKLLLDDEARLEYLLRTAGLLAASEGEAQPALPPDFLMDMMDLNEQAEILRKAQHQQGLSELFAQVSDLAAAEQAQLDPLLQAHDAAADPSTQQIALQQAVVPYLKRRYLLRLQEGLHTFAA